MDPNSSQDQANTQEPITYDKDGQLIAPTPVAPAQPTQPQPAPQVVYVSRAVEPVTPQISPEIKAKHDESVKRHPSLNLSESEYVISAVRRHPIGLILPLGVTIFLVAFVASLMINYTIIVNAIGILDPPPLSSALFIGMLLLILFLIGGYISYWVYTSNKFFLTNESVIQEIQTSLFTRHEQTVSLTNIEDASFLQQGFLQSLLDYGSIRLSTEGDETTYRFSYVAHPKREIAILNNAVEAFKNGRPVVDDSDN
jgi:uncharacterized membrane protein YdbT with pleckstrin-like domain